MNSTRARGGSDMCRIRVSGLDCVYCGEPAETQEHFPPLAYGNAGWLLPACAECNCFAGAYHPVDFEKRAKRVRKRLTRRYRGIVQHTAWSDEELAELGPNLRQICAGYARQKRRLEERLSWSWDAYLAARGKSATELNDYALLCYRDWREAQHEQLQIEKMREKNAA